MQWFVAFLSKFLLIHVSFGYSSFRNRLSLGPSTATTTESTTKTRLEQFCEAAWYHYHGIPMVPPSSPGGMKTTTTTTTSSLLPGQKCDVPFPNLNPVQPFHPEDTETSLQELKKHYSIIQQELEHYLQHQRRQGVTHGNEIFNVVVNDGTFADDNDDWHTSITNLCQDTSGFTKLMLQESDGTPTAVGGKFFPQTLSLIHSMDDISLAPRPVCINCQKPQTGLAPHSDNMNFLLTVHLGLWIPKDGQCVFYNHNEERRWTEGGVVVADTSFIHYTRNESHTSCRYILSFNIWHYDLTPEERNGILQIHDMLQREETKKYSADP